MPQLSIIVPTFNEVANVQELHRLVEAALPGISWEMIFVDDDSADGTVGVVRELAQRDTRVRCLHRLGRRGLVSACMEGMLASSAPLVAVMDADLQHDERLLPAMFEALQRDPQLQVVVGSRYVEGGGVGDWNALRSGISRLATRMGTAILKADLKDPMSGFFMIRHAAVLRCARKGMSGVGFKILLDLFASSPEPLRFLELPYQFRNRLAGESKLGTSVMLDYITMLVDHFLGGVLPVRFISFLLVGGFGLLVHMAVLTCLYSGVGIAFLWAQSAATVVAMTCNYLLNNVLTYRDMRLRGWRLATGWISFSLACSVGALANVRIAEWVFEYKPSWWLLSAMAGVLVGAVWNYVVTGLFTWKKPQAA